MSAARRGFVIGVATPFAVVGVLVGAVLWIHRVCCESCKAERECRRTGWRSG